MPDFAPSIPALAAAAAEAVQALADALALHGAHALQGEVEAARSATRAIAEVAVVDAGDTCPVDVADRVYALGIGA